MPERKGYNTKARELVTCIFEKSGGKTLSASEILSSAREHDSGISESTVYRILSRLEKDGLLIKYVSEKGESAVYQFVGNSGPCKGHLHLKCTRCKEVYHLDCHFMEELSSHLYSEHGFKLSCEGSIIYGLCKKCAK